MHSQQFENSFIFFKQMTQGLFLYSIMSVELVSVFSFIDALGAHNVVDCGGQV